MNKALKTIALTAVALTTTTVLAAPADAGRPVRHTHPICLSYHLADGTILIRCYPIKQAMTRTETRSGGQLL